MVQLTSAEAAKILKKLNEELSSVMRKEEQSKDFLAAMGEDPAQYREEIQRARIQRQYDRSMIMRIQARRLTKSKRRFGY